MKTKIIIPILSLLLISCGSTARKNYDEAQKKEKAEREAYRHNYWYADWLYERYVQPYGIFMSKEEFHQAMESPIKAEIFLNNLLDEGILDEKKEVRGWIINLYDSLPSELNHLDLGKCIDSIPRKGIYDDILDLISSW